jgi:hypothetical protein
MRDRIKRRHYVINVINAINETCAWCGQVKKTPKGKAYLYQYGTNDDWKGDEWEKSYSVQTMGKPLLFDGIECHRAYHGYANKHYI